MTLLEIRNSVRSTLQDTIGTDSSKYWPDSDLNEYINEGYGIFCRSTKIIRDSITPAICHLVVSDNTQNVAISPLIIQIERAKPSWSSRLLSECRTSDLDSDNPAWIGSTGTPQRYVLDFSDDYLTLDHKLSAAGTIDLTVKRMPLADMVDDNDVPEFKSQYHWMLKDYALFRAFTKQDSEVYNPEKGVFHRRLFMGDDETSPGGHILRVITELDSLPKRRPVGYF